MNNINMNTKNPRGILKTSLAIVGTTLAAVAILSPERIESSHVRRQLLSAIIDTDAKHVRRGLNCTNAKQVRSNLDALRRLGPVYHASPAEQYVVDNIDTIMGSTDKDGDDKSNNVKGCSIWNDKTASPFHASLQQHLEDLDTYNELTTSFAHELDDVRSSEGQADHIHMLDITNVFSKSDQLSTCNLGYIEPLLTPMRHPKWCKAKIAPERECPPHRPDCNYFNWNYVIDPSYLVHDWLTMGRSIKNDARTVFIDIGASLAEHSTKWQEVPVIDLIFNYKKFGIKFDHYYGYDTQDLAHSPPDFLQPAFHTNSGCCAGVDTTMTSDAGSEKNPFTKIKKGYTRDDFVVVKIDIDDIHTNQAFMDQLLQDDGLAKKIDVLYWEHHAGLREFRHPDGHEIHPKDSIELMQKLRQKGVCAHYWV